MMSASRGNPVGVKCPSRLSKTILLSASKSVFGLYVAFPFLWHSLSLSPSLLVLLFPSTESFFHLSCVCLCLCEDISCFPSRLPPQPRSLQQPPSSAEKALLFGSVMRRNQQHTPEQEREEGAAFSGPFDHVSTFFFSFRAFFAFLHESLSLFGGCVELLVPEQVRIDLLLLSIVIEDLSSERKRGLHVGL